MQLGTLGAAPPYLLAVSGGLDSMALWALAHAAALPHAVAHVNYGLRGADSDADEALVRSTAAAREVPCFVLRDHSVAGERSGVQERARAVRGDYLTRTARERGYPSILLAHHADDQVETVLQRWLRGAGPQGAVGMAAATPPRYRPLLGYTRAQLSAYAAAASLDYRDDRSNATPAYQRNRIRQTVVPALLEENPNLHGTVLAALEHQRAQNAFAAAAADEVLARARVQPAGERYDRQALASTAGLDYLVHHWLYARGYGPGRTRAISLAITDGKAARRTFAADDRREVCVVAGNLVYLVPNTALPAFTLAVSRVRTYESVLGFLTVRPGQDPTPVLCWLTAGPEHRIAWPTGGRKAVGRVLAQAKEPPLGLNRASVLVDADGEVLWVVGTGWFAPRLPAAWRERLAFEPRSDPGARS